MSRVISWLQKVWQMLKDPCFVLCFGIAWMITNGWSHIALFIGSTCHIPWMVAVSSSYLTVLWIPGTPEKIVTVAIAAWLKKMLFSKNTEET